VSKSPAGILATGSYLPERLVSNAEVAGPAGTTEEWIVERTGIRGRRYAAPHEATSDLAARAAANALAQRGLPIDRVDYLIVATSTPDRPVPPVAHLVQRELGARRTVCFDINVVCSGFVYGLSLAQALIAVNPGAHVLVVAADLFSRSLDVKDRRTAVLFGDGAGAALVGPVPESYGFIEFDLTSHGEVAEFISIDAGGTREPASHSTVDGGGHLIKMDGRAVRDFVLENVPPALAGLAHRAGVALDNVDHFVPHQANGVLLGHLVDKAGLGGAYTHRTVERYGNVGCASVPVSLDDANRSHRLNDGDLVLLSAFGGGMATGSCLLRWAATTPVHTGPSTAKTAGQR
jgi:3-oxoacyl-[acyl-carrier-protein] synthase-3